MAELISLLNSILENENKQKLVYNFLSKVYSDEFVYPSLKVEEIVRELAYDLEYYVEDSKQRTEDSSFYGNDRLKREIDESLTKIFLALNTES